MVPNTFIIGAPRSGTTQLYRLLGQHPEIFMSDNKEPWFFAFGPAHQPFRGPGDGAGVTNRAAYDALFEASGDCPVVGEASTLYLSSRVAPEAIRREAPGARLIAVLRDPCDRAYSNYAQHRWQEREKLEFREAIEAGPERVQSGWAPFWDYLDMSRYGAQLQRWRVAFPPDQMLVLLFDDLVADPVAVAARTYAFLGVDAQFEPIHDQPVNPSGAPRAGRLHHFMRGDSSAKAALKRAIPAPLRRRARAQIDTRNRRPDRLSGRDRAWLLPQLRHDIELASKLTGLDLSSWGQ